MLPWDLEDWITEVGADIVGKRSTNATAVSSLEELVYQIWLLDTESRNGGLSQYFCNHGIKQWRACEATAHANKLSAFAPFANILNAIVAGTTDPYLSISELGSSAENLWFEYQPAVVHQLKGLFINEAAR